MRTGVTTAAVMMLVFFSAAQGEHAAEPKTGEALPGL